MNSSRGGERGGPKGQSEGILLGSDVEGGGEGGWAQLPTEKDIIEIPSPTPPPE